MSHLPLLFANGQPTCLEKITRPQLERFIPFMIQCCPRSKKNPPQWWPKEVPFSFPLKPPAKFRQPAAWLNLLKSIVFKCYDHYESSYILSFCRKLSALGDKRLYYRENADRIDIIERNSNKLLVSVKSKNKTYDQPQASPHKSLLPRPLPGQEAYKSQPIIDDIYLCTYCDAEFTCCRDACEHERTVHAPVVEEQSTPQERHMKCLGLIRTSKPSTIDEKNVSKPRRITSNLNPLKCHSIPICTPLGRLLLANTSGIKPHEVAKAQDKLEMYCSTESIAYSDSNGIRRSRRVPGGTLARFRNPWSHTYCFNKKQRAERMETIRMGLDCNSRRLLRGCRPAKVKVRRLPPLPRNTTIDLKKLKDFISEEYPNQNVLEAHKPPPPVVVKSPIPVPAPVRTINRFNLMKAIPHMYAAFNKRPPLAGVPTNQMNTKCGTTTGIITKMVPFQQRKPERPREPIVVDLCSSDEECEVVVITEKREKTYSHLENAPKYGVTAASPKENCLKVSEIELAGVPVKDPPTVLFVQQFCRTRS